MSAFWPQTWYRMLLLWINRTLETHIHHCALRMPHDLLMGRSVRRYQMAVVDIASSSYSGYGSGPGSGDKDKEANVLVGYARWILPSQHAGSWSWTEARVLDEHVSEDEERRGCLRRSSGRRSGRRVENMEEGFDDPVYELLERYPPKGSYMKLDYLAIHPKYQRHGIGSKLVKSGIQEANKLNLEIFLVAMGQGALAMYKKLGFEVLGSNSQSLRPWGFDDVYETFFLVKRPDDLHGDE